MDAAQYSKHSKKTGLRGQKMVESLVPDWCETSLEVVIDLGCGPADISTYWIDHYFPDIGRLIGIDNDPVMVALARENNTKEKIEFHVADVTEKISLKKWEGRVDKIISIYVLHRVNNQQQAFRNIFDLLKPSGEAALYFLMNGPYLSAHMDLIKIPKWKSILETSNFVFPESHTKKYDVEQYIQMFENVGFGVSICEVRAYDDFMWESDDEHKSFLGSLHSVGEQQEEYEQELFKHFMKYKPGNSLGLPHQTNLLCAKLYKNPKEILARPNPPCKKM